MTGFDKFPVSSEVPKNTGETKDILTDNLAKKYNLQYKTAKELLQVQLTNKVEMLKTQVLKDLEISQGEKEKLATMSDDRFAELIHEVQNIREASKSSLAELLKLAEKSGVEIPNFRSTQGNISQIFFSKEFLRNVENPTRLSHHLSALPVAGVNTGELCGKFLYKCAKGIVKLPGDTLKIISGKGKYERIV